MKKKSTQVTIK